MSKREDLLCSWECDGVHYVAIRSGRHQAALSATGPGHEQRVAALPIDIDTIHEWLLLGEAERTRLAQGWLLRR